jgi:hypothetical protein
VKKGILSLIASFIIIADLPVVAKTPVEATVTSSTENAQGADHGQGAASSSPPAQRRDRPTATDSESELYRFSGIWNQEWAYSDGGSQKFEALVEPRLDVAVSDGVDLTMKIRLRGDTVGDLGPSQRWPDNYSALSGPWYNTEHVQVILREMFFDIAADGIYWRLGKQATVWGQADGLKVLDVVNPQSYREFILDDFDDSRIPLWAVSMETSLGGDASLQLLWIPDTTYHETAEAGTPFFVTSPRLVPRTPPGPLRPQILDVDKPDDPFSDGDAGARLSGFVGGWDLTLNYLYHYHDLPVLYRSSVGKGGEVIAPEYERNHLLGTTFSNAFGDLTLRGELAFNTDSFHVSDDRRQRRVSNSPELASVIGLDWQMTSDTLWSAQWFQSYLFDYDSATVRDESEHSLSLLFRSEFDNASWQLRVLTLYSINDNDSMLQVKLGHWFWSNLEVWVGTDLFFGSNEGLFGQFGGNDRLLLGFEYGF